MLAATAIEGHCHVNRISWSRCDKPCKIDGRFGEANHIKIRALVFGIGAAVALAWEPAMTQQITGTPGSPSATTTIEGNQIPPAPPGFGGVINERA